MARLIANANHRSGTTEHFRMAILNPNLIPDMFYEGQVCMHGHRLRHKNNHWCFNCAFKIYANQCGKDINEIHSDHVKYCYLLFEGLPTNLDASQCWSLPDVYIKSNPDRPRYTALTHRSLTTGQTESIPLARWVYFYFWGDVGTLVTSKQCKNPRCWNPLHVKSRFNVKPFPKTVQPLITKINITKSQEFQSRSLSIEEELTPKLKLIKSPKENKEVDIGSPFRPLESQFLSDLHDDRLNK